MSAYLCLCLSVCLSVCSSISLSAWHKSAPTGWIFIEGELWVFLEDLLRKFISLKSDKNNGTLHEDLCTFVTISRSFLLRMRNVSNQLIEEIKQNILCSINVFKKSCRLWDNMEKYCRARQATDDNMAHAHSMLDTKGYKHTLRICNTCCLSTATMFVHEHAPLLPYTYVVCLVHTQAYMVTVSTSA